MKKIALLFVLLCGLLQVWAQPRQITGKVTDKATGLGLPDVSVIEKQSSNGTKTDANGNFSLSVNKAGKVDLEISLVGYGTQLITTDGSAPVSVTMDQATKALDEVVVVGYGTVRKRDLTGSVVSVKSEEIKKVPAANAMEALQGKLSGVDIVRTSGSAGAKVNVTVRGNRSIIAQNGPLYIVDGIQYNDYQDINPNDIQSMEVLKDASSTAIYGSRGANGVVLITTKKGASGRAKITASAYAGQSEIAGYPKPMTGAQFAQLKRESYRTAGRWSSPADDAKIFTPTELANINNNVSTYWPGLLLQKGSQQDYNAGVSAGTDKTKIYFSYGYFKETGVLNNDYSGRSSLRLNIDQALANTLRVGLQSQFTYYNENLRADNILTVANKVLPYFTPYNDDGTLAKYPGNGAQFNPLMEELPGAYENKNNTSRLLSTAFAEWKPLEGLSIRSNLGILNSSSRNGRFEDANTISRALSTGSLSRVTNSNNLNVTWENIITYQKNVGDHNLQLTGVTSYLSNTSENGYAQGTGQLLPSQSFWALQNNPANLAIYSNYSADKLLSGTFRMNYSYKGKYLVTLTGREDGASVLAQGRQWSFFPSAAVAWRIIDEPFMQDQRLLNDLKVRASYGVTGNSSVKPYQTQSNVLLIPFSWNDKSALAYGLDPQTGNPNLKWELTGTQNIGLDFALLKNRVSGSLDVYDSKTHDLLFMRQLPATSGVSKILENIGKTRNTGFELTLNTVNIRSAQVSWTSGLTYTRNKERIVDLVNGQSDIANSLIIGYPVYSFYDYQKVGIWQTADSAAARSYGYKPGDIRVNDINGDKTITANNDRIVLGSAVPRYSLGFNNDVKLWNFDLNVYVFARIGQMFESNYANKYEPNAIENGAVVDYWTPENPTNDYPRPNSGISRAALPFATTLGYKDGSFVKIRNLTLGYTIPGSMTKRLGMGNVRIYASAKNYFTFAKVKDYDPEGGGSFERPLTKLLVGGINLNF